MLVNKCMKLLFNWRIKNKPFLFLIYQMGKVGSSTIYRTLKKHKINAIHTHSHKEAQEIIKNYKGKIFIISGVREPLSRNISAFFENFNNKTHKYWYIGDKNEIKNLKVERLIEIFNERDVLQLKELLNPWFDTFYDTCNIKKEDFVCTRNVYKLNKKNLEIIIYKLENFKDFENYFLKRFSKLISFKKFDKTNLASDKYYFDLYKEFKNCYFIDHKKYQNLYKNIDYLSDYYTENEVQNYSEKFIKNKK